MSKIQFEQKIMEKETQRKISEIEGLLITFEENSFIVNQFASLYYSVLDPGTYTIDPSYFIECLIV